MPRLIDADSVEREIKRVYCPGCEYCSDDDYFGNCLECGNCRALEIVISSPTVDTEPVIYGHWMKKDNQNYSPFDWGTSPYIYTCSQCGAQEYHPFGHCHCGAKMMSRVVQDNTKSNEDDTEEYIRNMYCVKVDEDEPEES